MLNRKQKSLLLFLTSILPLFLLKIVYRKLIDNLSLIFKANNLDGNRVFFFDNLDFCIGFLLNNQDIVNKIIIDRPGIATLEFDYKYKTAKNSLYKFILKLKKFVSVILESKIVKYSSRIIVASQNMLEFYLSQYPNTSPSLYHNIPYYVDSDLINSKVDQDLKKTLISRFKINKEDTVILFVGEFKRTGGVQDLIKVFINLYNKNKKNKLILIGGGYTRNQCLRIVQDQEAKNNIIFHGRTPYKDLRTYQDMAHIIVCPDRDNSFSRMIIHLKFWDALVSDKIVLCSGFPPILEVNSNENLCINFTPSDLNSLEQKLNYCVENKQNLLKKYSSNQNYTKNNFTYASLRTKLCRIFDN